MAKSSCGQHTDLASNSATRITRCTCGMVHITLVASGVTVRMPAEAFRSVADAFGVAVEKMDKVEITATGSTSIN